MRLRYSRMKFGWMVRVVATASLSFVGAISAAPLGGGQSDVATNQIAPASTEGLRRLPVVERDVIGRVTKLALPDKDFFVEYYYSSDDAKAKPTMQRAGQISAPSLARTSFVVRGLPSDGLSTSKARVTDEDYVVPDFEWAQVEMLAYLFDLGQLEYNGKPASELTPEERTACHASCSAEVSQDYDTYGNILCGVVALAALPSAAGSVAAGAGCLAGLGWLKPRDTAITCNNRCGAK